MSKEVTALYAVFYDKHDPPYMTLCFFGEATQPQEFIIYSQKTLKQFIEGVQAAGADLPDYPSVEQEAEAFAKIKEGNQQ